MRKTLLVAVTAAFLVTTAVQASASVQDLPAPAPTAPAAGSSTGVSQPALTGIRTGRHDRYDRTVFDFRGGTPGYRVQYDVLRPQGQDGVIPVNGAATLVVVFTGVTVSSPPGTRNPELPTLRQITFGGAFEGYASFGLGLRDRVGFRVFVLHAPERVVVDVAHQPVQAFQTTPFAYTGPAVSAPVERVRFGHHPGYDRVVFDLRGPDWPRFTAAYAGTALHLTLTGSGTYTFGTTTVRFTGSGVDIVTARRDGFRVLLLHNNTRIAVDLRT